MVNKSLYYENFYATIYYTDQRRQELCKKRSTDYPKLLSYLWRTFTFVHASFMSHLIATMVSALISAKGIPASSKKKILSALLNSFNMHDVCFITADLFLPAASSICSLINLLLFLSVLEETWSLLFDAFGVDTNTAG